MSDWLPPTTQHVYGNDDTAAADRRMVVWFFRKPIQHAVKSREAGRPIFEGRDFIHVQQPGERDFVEREAIESDRMRWPRKWEAYQAQREQDADGTPLATVFPNEPEIVEMLRAMRITTVEQLAGVSDNGLDNIGMGAHQFREKARSFLEASRGMAPVHAVQARLDVAEEKLRQRDETIAALEKRLARLEKTKEAA